MKIQRINRGALHTFWIFCLFVGISSFNITEDWATALLRGLVGGFVVSFIYILGYLMGVEEGEGKGFDKAMEDLRPVLPSDIQKSMEEQDTKEAKSQKDL